MSHGEGTHKPTPKRIKEFRKRGEIALSRDVTAVSALAGGAIAAALYASRSSSALTDLARECAVSADGRGGSLAGAAAHAFLGAAAPAMIGAAAGALIAGGVQLGWPPALKKPGFDLSRALPGAALQEAWSPKAMFRRAAIAGAKVAAVGAAVLLVVHGEVGRGFASETPAQLAGRIGGAVGHLAIAACMALAVLAAVDYVLARRRIGAKMKMTPDEMKRELREQEGDPQQKGKRRRRMREIAKRRVVAAVQAADVVVVNPTHYAVALSYRASRDQAPRVVAKGTDEVALRIREIAREAGVPVLSRPPLARALHKVPEGREVPAALFRAVAEVLAYVYRLRKQVRGAAS